MNWSEIYIEEIKSKGGINKLFKFKIKEKEPLIKRIIKNSINGNILEAGCGTGVISSYLSKQGYTAYAIDNDPQMLDLAKEISIKINSNVKFLNRNLFIPNFPKEYFDVVFSHGVLEHFSDQDIIRLLNIELTIGKKVIFSIPSDYFNESQKMYGDERFMSLDAWLEIIERTQGVVEEKFGYGFQNRIYKLINYVNKNSMLQKAPYLGFIIQKK